MKIQNLPIAFVILIAMLSWSCNKFDIDWKGKKNKNERNEFMPEEIRINGNLQYKVYFSRNNLSAEKISVWEFGSDEIYLINLNRKGHRIYFTNGPDTFFTAILNNKGQVMEVLQGNHPTFISSMAFQYSNDRVSRISAKKEIYDNQYMNLDYQFDYDTAGNCISVYRYQVKEGEEPEYTFIDKVLYEYDYTLPVNQQFYYFEEDFLLNREVVILDLIGVLPGMQPNNIRTLAWLTPVDSEGFQDWHIGDYVFDEYNNLTANSYTHQYEYFTASRNASVLWRKIKK